MQSSRVVRWGLLGPGVIAHTFARDIAFADNAELHAVASRSLSRAQGFAQQYGIARAYGNYQQLYQDPAIDAIYIATPHTLHLQQTLHGIAAGKSVLCEKPLTVSSRECEQIICAAANAAVTVVEGMWTLFLPAIQQAAQWLAQGRIGKLQQVHSSFGYPFDYDPQARAFNASLGGGCLLDMGIYPLALAWQFIGQRPQQIDAVARYAANGVENDVAMVLDYGAVSASLATSFTARLPNTTYLAGSAGYIAIPDSFRASECYLFQGDREVDCFKDARRGSGFEYQIRAVSDSILTGERESATIPLAHSLELQQQMERVRQAYAAPRTA
ncbi:MAG: Gfo/Idh/MocA family oxidoreductase [Pseudomonadales bacterium]|nr:Gfo/Idh/MocA family oxidoreductase [Pseudomonadales bacterium]